MKKEGSENMLSRREALKIMTFGAAGIAAGGVLLQSCSEKKPAHAAPFTYKEAPAGSKIVSREWKSLGEKIGLLGLGCMRLPKSQEDVNKMVDYAIEHGINYFDTAPAYRDSEKKMGIALGRYPRESYLLATKMSNFAFGPNIPTLDKAQAMFENSMANLNTDYFDFFLLHSIGSVKDFNRRYIENGVLDYLLEQKKAGHIHHLGFSFHGSNADLATMLDKNTWDFVMIQMNYVDWKNMPLDEEGGQADSETLYKTISGKGLPVAVMEPVRGGALANVGQGLTDLMAQEHPELSPAGMALSFVGSFPGVMVTLSGMSNIEQLKENVATFTDFKPFSEKDNEFMMKVARLYNENIHIPCTKCGYCLPCANGVDIPGNFAVFNKISDDLNMPNPEGPHDSDFKKKSKIFLKEYKAALEPGMRADACTECGVCLPKCPQQIRIPDQLRKIRELAAKL